MQTDNLNGCHVNTTKGEHAGTKKDMHTKEGEGQERNSRKVLTRGCTAPLADNIRRGHAIATSDRIQSKRLFTYHPFLYTFKMAATLPINGSSNMVGAHKGSVVIC
ncbi:hypothetical protein BDQ17DRAFT_1333262 [Cyathus striatus]|nr:hypothetical protein BDQ17DRAFT_1333262 [Cyathus striatus]